jgi:hypothetical protein
MFLRNTESLPETLFLIGNGAIENGNKPFQNALRIAESENYFNFNPLKLGISSLSCVRLFEQQMFDLLILHLKGAHPQLPSDGTLSGFQLCVGKLYAYAIRFRQILAQSYREAASTLQIRPNVWQLLNKYGIGNDSSACVTTNWDPTIWNETKIKTVLHLHGHCNNPSSLILPTETITERALKAVLISEIKDKLLDFAGKEQALHPVRELIRYYDMKKLPEMFEPQTVLENWFASAKKIIVVGINFNDYDHELIEEISNHARKNPCEIIIINRARNPEDRKHKIEKAAGLFSCSSSDITFIQSDRNWTDASKKTFARVGKINIHFPSSQLPKLTSVINAPKNPKKYHSLLCTNSAH